MKITRLFLGLLLLSAAPAWAQEEESPKVKKARSENELEKEGESTDQACGTKLKVSIDWASFEANPAGWSDKSVSGYCESGLGALRSLCEGQKAKAYVAKTVKEYVCRAVKTKEEWKAVRKAGTLEWLIPPDAVNADSYAKAELLKNL